MSDAAQDIINRAIALIDATSPADMTAILAQASIHDHLKADPAALRANLANDGHPFISRRLAAQQVLQAADAPKIALADESPAPARLAPLDGAHLNASQADLILTLLAGFKPASAKDAARAHGLKIKLSAALDAFYKAHAND